LKVHVFFPHKLKNKACGELADSYVRLASRYCQVDLSVTPYLKSGRTSPALLERVRSTDAVFLSERARPVDTRYFVDLLKRARMTGGTPAFLVGDAEGVPQDLESACRASISLSPLTLPHELALVVLLEQLWRAVSILENHPYHK
jgi:23S rRNA (pseudouridine1915-N3)-methyltransferase